jgi:hypothetical protein
MSKLFTLLAGYAAGLAVAVAYRKSKTPDTEILKDGEWIDAPTLLNEIVDIHRDMYAGLRAVGSDIFAGVTDRTSLEARISEYTSTAADTAEMYIQKALTDNNIDIATIRNKIDTLQSTTKDALVSLKGYTQKIPDMNEQDIADIVQKAVDKIEDVYANIRNKYMG